MTSQQSPSQNKVHRLGVFTVTEQALINALIAAAVRELTASVTSQAA